MNNEANQPAYILIEPKDNRTEVEWQYSIVYRKQGGKFSCYIPSFNIYFSAKDEAVMDKKSEALTKMYLDHFVLHSKGGFKALAMQLHKLGFKAKDDALVLKRILKDQKIVKTKFNATSSLTPEGFNESKSIHHQMEFEAA